MQSLSYYIEHPNVAALRILVRYGTWIPDKLFLKIKYRLSMGHRLDLRQPKTFGEKLQWLKLYDRKPEYTVMVDKVKAKEYVASILGEEYIIPTLGVWDDPEKIDFDSLPERFVIKCNHNSGLGMYICKDKSKMDVEKVKAELRKGLKQNYFAGNREWPYKNVPRLILAEQYIDPSPDVTDLPDYQWYCFDGEPKFCQVIQNRSVEETIDFFDTNWQHQTFIGLDPKAENACALPKQPVNLDTHLRIARELSKGIPFSRIDLYETAERTYFGEVTFFPASGLGSFRPSQYDEILGRMVRLPGENRGRVIIRQLRGDELVFEKPDLRDYKFFCFDGKVRCFKIDFNRQVNHHANYYNREGKLLPFGEKDFPPQPHNHIEIPLSLSKMLTLAETIAEGHSFLRVDFYDHFGKVFFGELTFFPNSGMGKFEPEEWGQILGNWIKLPTE